MAANVRRHVLAVLSPAVGVASSSEGGAGRCEHEHERVSQSFFSLSLPCREYEHEHTMLAALYMVRNACYIGYQAARHIKPTSAPY